MQKTRPDPQYVSLDFINDLFEINIRMEDFSNNLLLHQTICESLRQDFINKRIGKKEYDFNIKMNLKDNNKFIKDLEMHKNKAIELFAISRILGKENKRKTLLFGLHISKHYPKDIDERKKKEIEVVEKEIKEHEERLIRERKENV